MEWDNRSIMRLYALLQERHRQMRLEKMTDRKNFSSIWNKYLEGYGVRLVRSQNKVVGQNEVLRSIIDIINYENELVRYSVVVRNPDRPNEGQYLIFSRDTAEKILILGTI